MSEKPNEIGYQVASRIALSDLVLGETKIGRGEQALIVLGAGNRDPARYADPDRLDLTRTDPSHLAFGGGPHFCVGAGLARLEAQETFKRIAQSIPTPTTGSWSHTRDRSRTFRRVRTLNIGTAGLAIRMAQPTPSRLGSSSIAPNTSAPA